MKPARWRRLRIWAARKLDPFDWTDDTRASASKLRAWLDEVPDESEYDVSAETTPATQARLTRLGDELHAVASQRVATRRRHLERWRRPSLATGTVATALVLVAAGGASAVGIDVPVVGNALDTLTSGRSTDDPPIPRVSAADALDIAADPGGTTDLLVVPVGGTSGEVIGAGYIGGGRHVCIGTRTRGGGLPTALTPKLGCWEPAALTQRLTAAPGIVSGYKFGEPDVVVGYARIDVEAISVSSPDGPLTVALSEQWKPEGLGVLPLRVFLAVTSYADLERREGLDSDDLDRAMEPGYYDVEARMADGSIVKVEPLTGSSP